MVQYLHLLVLSISEVYSLSFEICWSLVSSGAVEQTTVLMNKLNPIVARDKPRLPRPNAAQLFAGASKLMIIRRFESHCRCATDIAAEQQRQSTVLVLLHCLHPCRLSQSSCEILASTSNKHDLLDVWHNLMPRWVDSIVVGSTAPARFMRDPNCYLLKRTLRRLSQPTFEIWVPALNRLHLQNSPRNLGSNKVGAIVVCPVATALFMREQDLDEVSVQFRLFMTACSRPSSLFTIFPLQHIPSDTTRGPAHRASSSSCLPVPHLSAPPLHATLTPFPVLHHVAGPVSTAASAATLSATHVHGRARDVFTSSVSPSTERCRRRQWILLWSSPLLLLPLLPLLLLLLLLLCLSVLHLPPLPLLPIPFPPLLPLPPLHPLLSNSTSLTMALSAFLPLLALVP